MSKKCKKLTVEYPLDEYASLKMVCAKEGITLKEFVYEAIQFFLLMKGLSQK